MTPPAFKARFASARWLALAVFCLGLALSLGIARWHAEQDRLLAAQRLELAAVAMGETLRLRINNFNQALLGLRGAFGEGGRRFDRFREFDRVVDLLATHPGALAVGYAERVSQDSSIPWLSALGRRHGREISLKAAAVNNGDRFLVGERIGSADLGTDLAAFTAVREAGLRATWYNRPALSAPVAGQGGELPTFFLVLPVYRGGVAPIDAMPRHELTEGWLFVQFSGERLMHGLGEGDLLVRLSDRDGEEVVPVFASSTLRLPVEAGAMRHARTEIVAGRTWEFEVFAGPDLVGRAWRATPWTTTAAGVAISVLAALLVQSLVITRRRALRIAERMTAALRLGERQLAQILGGSPVAMFVIDTAHRVSHWNRACEVLTGVAAEAVVGRSEAWRGFYDAARPTLADCIVDGVDGAAISRHYGAAWQPSPVVAGALQVESYFERFPGGGRWLFFMAAPLRDESGRLLGAIETLYDITARHRAEQALGEQASELRVANDELARTLGQLRETQHELVRREKLAALGSLVAGVAHEINTPLGNALAVASTLHDESVAIGRSLREGLRRSVLEAYIAKCRDGAQLLLDALGRTAQLVGSFKRVAVNQAQSERRAFDLAETVRTVEILVRSGLRVSGVALESTVPEGIRLDSFPGELEQILIALVSNAITHGFEGSARGTIRIDATAQNGWVRLVVADDGKGIAAEVLPRIFDPFFTTRFGAGDNGLGLHIAYNQVTAILGGTIRVDSRPGEGARFILDLPLHAP